MKSKTRTISAKSFLKTLKTAVEVVRINDDGSKDHATRIAPDCVTGNVVLFRDHTCIWDEGLDEATIKRAADGVTFFIDDDEYKVFPRRQIPALEELLAASEPKNKKTAPDSLWNRARKEIEFLNNQIVAEGYFWDPKAQDWVFWKGKK